MKKQAFMTLAIVGSLLATATSTMADTTNPDEQPGVVGPSTTTPDTTYTQKPFSDVELGSPYIKYIADLKGKGIVIGNPDGTFGPNDSLTRAAFAVMLVKTFKLPISTKPVKFEDSKSHWANMYIQSAFEAGIVAGTSDTTFEPDATLTREQAAAMVWRYLKANGLTPSATNITLASGTDEWAVEAIKNTIAYHLNGPNEVTQKDGGQDYGSQDTMTRQSAAALIDLALDVQNHSTQTSPTSPTSTQTPKTYTNHAGTNLNPVPVQKGMAVSFYMADGSLSRTTTVTDLLNPTTDPSNLIFNAQTNSYTFGNVAIVDVKSPQSKYDSVMQTFTDQMNAGGQLLSKASFVVNGSNGVTINLPSTGSTNYVWKYFDQNAVVQVANGSTISVPYLNSAAGNSFTFFLDNNAAPYDHINMNYGQETIFYKGNGTFSSSFATVDIN